MKLFPLFILMTLFFPGASQAQPQSFATYADQDYKDYLASKYAGPQWDPFVKEGFEAMDRQDYLTALEFMRKAANLGCQSPIMFFKMALGFEAQSSYYSAIQYYELAREQFKDTNQAHRYYKQFEANYGRALFLMGQTDRALPILEAAVRQNDEPWILRLLGNIYMARGDYAKAPPYYERLLKMPNSNLNKQERLEILIQLARVYRNMRQEDAAQRYYQQALEIDASQAEAIQYIRDIERRRSQEKFYESMEKMNP